MKALAIIISLTLVACAPPLWVKPGGTTAEFDKDKYNCLQSSQQRASGLYFNKFGGGASDQMVTNDKLFSSCMNSRGWKLTRGDEASKYVADQTAKIQEVNVTMEQLKQENYALCAKAEYAWINQRSACNANELTLAQLSNTERLNTTNRDSFMAFYAENKNLSRRRIEVINASGDRNSRALVDIMEKFLSSRERSALELYEGKVTWGEYNKDRKRDSESFEAARKKLPQR